MKKKGEEVRIIPMAKAILFDQDGTLLDSAPGIKSCARFTLKKLGYPVIPEKDLDFFIGPPLGDCFRLCGVKEDDIQKAVDTYRLQYQTNGKYLARLYPNVESVLKSLKGKGHRLYVCTCKGRSLAIDILKHFGLFAYFDGVYGARKDGRKSTKGEIISDCLRENAIEKDAIMVGDTELDAQGAKDNKIPCLIFEPGYGDKKKIREQRPAGYFQDFASLPQILENL